MDIIRSLPNNANKSKLLSLNSKMTKYTIATVFNNNKKMYIDFSDTGTDKMIIDDTKHFIVPYFNFTLQDRLLIIINGYSRSGKSIFLKNYILNNYKMQFNNDRKMFYICPSSHEHDISLKDEKLIYLNAGQFEMADNIIERFSKSLVIVDDIDSVKNNDVWRCLSMLANVGGKFNIDLIFVTHSNTVIVPNLKLNLVSDCDYYVTYNIMQNRFFEIYNKDAPIDQFRTDTLITCRPKFKVIMSDKRIIKY